MRDFVALMITCTMHAIVCDDNDIVRAILSKYISQDGHCLTVCRDADTAFSVYQDNRTITHIWTDIYLDRSSSKEIPDGITLIEFVRSFEKDSMMKPCNIIGFSSDESLEKKVLDAGANRFLKKPLNYTTVREIMKSE